MLYHLLSLFIIICHDNVDDEYDGQDNVHDEYDGLDNVDDEYDGQDNVGDYSGEFLQLNKDLLTEQVSHLHSSGFFHIQ